MSVKMLKWVLPLFCIVLAIPFVYQNLNIQNSQEINKGVSINYKGYVCAYVKHKGSDWQLVGCNHNLITNAGKDYIENALAHGGSIANVTVIAVANNTVAQSATDTSLQGEWTTCGLARAQANEFTDNGYGNWSIAYTWTVTCDDVIVNATGLYTNEATPTLFAETTLPKSILYNTDNYKVTWTISVS